MNISLSSQPIHHTPIEIKPPVLKVLGLGGGGSNAVNRMIELGLTGVEYIAANTDCQALKSSLAPTKIQLGSKLTRGLGAGGKPSIGEAAAEESYKDLNTALAGADMVFLTAGMGGGTGTGSISIAARVVRALGAVSVAIVTTPFSFEVGRRQQTAREGLARLRPYIDTLVTVPNDRLLQVAPKDLPLELAFRLADDVLRQGIQGITELITQPGLINVDFAHVRTMMQTGGGSLLSIGQGQGPNKALQAIERALHHPLLDSICLDNVTGIIANFTGGSDMTFIEVADALSCLQEKTNNRAEIIPGVITDDRMEGRAQVILIITGLGATSVDAIPVKVAAQPVVSQPVPAARPTPVMPPQPIRPASYPFAALQAVQTGQTVAASTPVMSSPQPEPRRQMAASSPTDLDLPAFMRRRIR
jgi:cell division protein FtsZ